MNVVSQTLNHQFQRHDIYCQSLSECPEISAHVHKLTVSVLCPFAGSRCDSFWLRSFKMSEV